MKTRFVHILLITLVAVFGLERAAHADDNEVRTADLYKRFTYDNVSSSEADEIFSSAGIKSFNPKNKMKNVDPEWIPGWDMLALTDETKTAILQAAINRTWTAKVHADYKRYRSAWAGIENHYRPELERAKTGTYYARAAALAKLLDDVREQATAEKILFPANTAPATVGFVNDIVLAMVDLHRQTKREFMVASYLEKRSIKLADFEAGGRSFAADAIERELFTAFSQANGNFDTSALPTMSEYGKAFAAVKWPTLKNAAEAKKAAAKLVETTAAALTLSITIARMPALFTGDLAAPADPKLRYVDPPEGGTDHYSPLLVTKVERKNDGAVVSLETKFDKSVPYGCKNTRTLDTTNSGRTFVQDCKYKHEITKHSLEVMFAELPDGLEIQNGDQLAFYGDLESKKEAKTQVSYKLTARSLASVKRGGKVVWE